ncbi:MAG: hypothetical protein Q4P71_09010 [Actinomycetaceae bacterium]|nr:hypothetical protein [Actinomycetaceae bacterium]
MSERYFVVRSGATALRNETVHDQSISIQALGLLTVMLSMPAGAPLGYRAFMGRGMGQQALLKSIRELEAAGYRWRFTKRDDAGRITTVVGVFDCPHSQLEAEKALAGIQSGRLSCQSIKDDFSAGSNDEDLPLREKATHGEKPPLREKATHGEVDTVREEVMQRADLRKQSPLRDEPTHRRTVPRLSDAQLSRRDNSKKDNKLSFLPSSENEVSIARADCAHTDVDGGKGGNVESTSVSCSVLSAEVVERVALSLPDSMCALGSSDMRRVWRVLEPKLEAGWTPGEIRRQLSMRSLPDPVHDMASLVCHRIGELLDAPVRASEVVRRRREREEIPATASVPLSEAERAEDVRVQALFERVRAEHPEWTPPQVARHVIELERESRQGVS